MATRAAKKSSSKSTRSKSSVVIEKSAGAVVFHTGKQVEYLLIYSTYWEFPKGMIDANEQEEEAARREVREETGLEVELQADWREAINYFYRRRESGALVKKQVVYFLGKARSQRVKISWEHRDARWATYDAALELLKYENARSILTKGNERITAAR